MAMDLLTPIGHRGSEMLRLFPLRLLGAPLTVVDNADI